MTDYKDVVEFLFEQYPSYQKKGVDAYKPDLSNIYEICKIIGNPQNKLKFIHVAGSIWGLLKLEELKKIHVNFFKFFH